MVLHTPTKLVVYVAKCLYNLLCKLEHHRLHTVRVNQFFVHSENFGSTCLVAPYSLNLFLFTELYDPLKLSVGENVIDFIIVLSIMHDYTQ